MQDLNWIVNAIVVKCFLFVVRIIVVLLQLLVGCLFTLVAKVLMSR